METLEQLIDLHRNNFKDLRVSRSLSPVSYWQEGEVQIKNLTLALKRYSNKVGILLYTYDKEALLINLIDSSGEIGSEKLEIGKEELIQKINKTNQYFSGDVLSRAPQKRGIVSRKKQQKTVLKEAYEQLSKSLLPFSLENFDHLIIVPTLNIGTLPFAALKDVEDNYLIDKASYSIATSVYELLVSDVMNNLLHDDTYIEEQEWRDYNYHSNLKNCLFVVNPAYPSNTDWFFPDLLGTEKEVAYIKENLGVRNFKEYIGEFATHENILKDICTYDLLYFGTHGIADSDNPLDKSFLVVSEQGEGNFFITAREIQDIRHTCQLKASLVVLSACETGLGKEHEGGIIGLARAFQIAGANHTLMSLWSISDQETATLIKLFFKYLKKGGKMLPHEAMRKAILAYKEENDNPKYWASFSIFGLPMITHSPDNFTKT